MALQRLSELNRTGQGVPKDNVKALGYARLVERLSPPGSAQQRNVVTMISELGNEMALEEVALAVSFADQLEAQIRRQSGDPASGAENAAAAGHSAAPATNNPSLPGMAPSPAARIPGVGAPTPGTVLPGVPATRAQ
ncbi:hypothetical protein [Diaphorobacter aerolatus]|uniref:hypothetical protein n=1 Tax=Diaphorobacter aerolatus TaxID=1288495 RepID=UPI001D01FD2C|nr:hypothetical protein [Diaphorobacter aerolatus]